MLRVVSEGFGWSIAATWMPTSRAGMPLQLRCAAFWHAPRLDGMAPETASRQLRLGAGEGLLGRVWEARQARVADVSAEPHSRRVEEARQDGMHSCCLLPIHGRDEVVAVLELLSDEILSPDPILLEMLNRVAGQIGEFLERRGIRPRRALATSAS